jgi:biotin operon repressor
MFADFHQLICRLCQRQFKSQETLSKHIGASDLHKQNLEKHIEQLRKEQVNEEGVEDEEQKHYRDRAEERRKVFKDSDIPPGLHRANEERVAFEQSRPPEAGLGPRAEIGAKLLQQMGWSEGERLGKHQSGLQAPVEVQLRPSGLGLGAESTHLLPSVSNFPDSYKETVKASARSRFEHLKRGEPDVSSRGPISSDPEDEAIPNRAGLGS